VAASRVWLGDPGEDAIRRAGVVAAGDDGPGDGAARADEEGLAAVSVGGVLEHPPGTGRQVPAIPVTSEMQVAGQGTDRPERHGGGAPGQRQLEHVDDAGVVAGLARR